MVFFSVTCLKVWREIIRSNYDVIWLHGYNYFGLVLAFLAAKVANKRILYRSETHLNLSRCVEANYKETLPFAFISK